MAPPYSVATVAANANNEDRFLAGETLRIPTGNTEEAHVYCILDGHGQASFLKDEWTPSLQQMLVLLRRW